jgi:hypothetical protein
MIIFSDRVMESFPQPLDLFDSWMTDGLKEQFELGAVGEPALCDVVFITHEILDDKHNSSSARTGHFLG